jgi:hypothetical protein
MGLIGGIARTAVIAGTATAVSNRVSRRQGQRWQQQADEQEYEAQQQGQYQQQYQQGPPAAPPAAESSAAGDGTAAELERLAALKDQGALNDEEFAAAKKKLLGL